MAMEMEIEMNNELDTFSLGHHEHEIYVKNAFVVLNHKIFFCI